MENIEIISLDLSKSKEIQLSPKVLAKMKKLRILKVYYSDHSPILKKEYKVFLLKDFEFPPNLIYLHWEGYTSKSLPSNFHGENLVALNLRFSNIKELWKSEMHLAELKFLDLSYSKQLIKIPARMPKLRELNLEGCTSFHNLDSSIGVFHDMKFLTKLNFRSSEIKELPSSIGYLKSLEALDLTFCSNFEKFPEIQGNMKCLKKLWLCDTAIKELPSSIGSLTSLEMLDLSMCSKFNKFPDIFANMGRLRELHLAGTGIKELPSSTGYLKSLELLDLSSCSNFEKFPEIHGNVKCIGSLTSLEMLFLSRCPKFKKLPDMFANMGRLWFLDLSGSGIKELPSSIGYLESLEELNLSYCSNFEKFSEIQGNMKCLVELSLKGTPIKKLPNNIECWEALKVLDLRNCSNLEKLPEFQRNMGSLHYLDASGTAIKELSCSMGYLTQLQRLDLENCKKLTSIPSGISELKSLEKFSLNGCSNVEIFSEIMEDTELLEHLYLRELGIIELPYSIERLKGLRCLEVSNCENLESLPNSVGNLTRLQALFLPYCRKLHKLPDSLRSLQCCLHVLDVGGCNLMEGAIPSDLWCLFSLVSLSVSENNIRRIPASIIQLSWLDTLLMNHCPMLEEIPELPSSLRRIEAHGCPFLENLSSDQTHLLWSCLLNCFKSKIQDFVERLIFVTNRSNRFAWRSDTVAVIPGRSGVPEWVSHKSMGCEIRIELPKNWYEDNNFLGFALFFHLVPLDDVCQTIYEYDCTLPHPYTPCYKQFDGQFFLWIFNGDQFEHVNTIEFDGLCKAYLDYYHYGFRECRGKGRTSSLDPALRVAYIPQIAISSEYRSSGWNDFKACFHGLFCCGGKATFKVESCGIHLIYDDAQDHYQQSLQPFNVKRSHDDIEEDHPHHKKSRHCLVSSSFHLVEYVEGSSDNVGGTEKNHPPKMQYVNSVVPGMQDDGPKHIPQLDLLGDFGEHRSVVEDTNGDADHKGHSTFGEDAQVHDDDEDDLVFRWQMMMMI